MGKLRILDLFIGIGASVRNMIDCAIKNKEMLFYVTPIGTGLAGFTKTQIQGLFDGLHIPENVVFSREWFTEKWN